MAGYQYPYQSMQNQFNQFPSIQQMFPQPQGSVYSINSPLEIGNVPIGSTGLSVALCLSDNLMYIKSFQNGNPVIMTYNVTPHNSDQKQTQTAPDASEISITAEQLEKIKLIDELQQKVVKLEDYVSHSGGKYDGLL